MDSLTKKVLENAKALREKRIASKDNVEKENIKNNIEPIIKKFESNDDIKPVSPKIKLPSSPNILSVKERIENIQKLSETPTSPKHIDCINTTPVRACPFVVNNVETVKISSSLEKNEKKEIDHVGNKRKSEDVFTYDKDVLFSGDSTSLDIDMNINNKIILSSESSEYEDLKYDFMNKNNDNVSWDSEYLTSENILVTNVNRTNSEMSNLDLPKSTLINQDINKNILTDEICQSSIDQNINEKVKEEFVRQKDKEGILCGKVENIDYGNFLGEICDQNESINNQKEEECLMHNKKYFKKYFEDIQKNINNLQRIIVQTSQALNSVYTKSKTKPIITKESIEAERVLLLNSEKLEYYRSKEYIIMNNEYICGCNAMKGDMYSNILTISNMSIVPKSDYFNQNVKDIGVFYFIIVVSLDSIFYSSCVSSILDVVHGSLKFDDKIKLQSINENDKICFRIYSINSNSKPRQSSSDSLHKIKSKKGDSTNKKSKFIKMIGNKMSYSTTSISCMPRESMFKLVGEAYYNNPRSGSHKLCFISSSDCPITGVITFNLTVENSHECLAKGFLSQHYRDSKSVTWRRYWCCMYRDNISSWEYPIDEHIKKPLQIIKLQWNPNITTNIESLTTIECARPYSFRIYLNPSIYSEPFIFSADSKEEYDRWISCFQQHVQRQIPRLISNHS